MANAACFEDMRARTVPHLLAFAAEQHGSRRFLRESGSPDWLTFADAARHSHAAARGFARLGIKRGDYIPFMLPNCPEFVLAWFGANLRAAAYISVNTSLTADLLAAQLALAPSSPSYARHGRDSLADVA